MLGVEVFREKQGLGQKERDGENEVKEEAENQVEKDAEKEGAVENKGELDLENADENGSSEPKMDSGNQGTSSWEEETGRSNDWRWIRALRAVDHGEDHMMWKGRVVCFCSFICLPHCHC